MTKPIVLRSSGVYVSVRPEHGFVVTSIQDRLTGAEALWSRPEHKPAVCTRRLGLAGSASTDTFLDLFVGGWFEMFPSAGTPGTVAGAPTFLHGEATRLPWTVTERAETHLEAVVRLLRTPFAMRRVLKVEGSTVISRSTATNVGRERAPYTWGHHPCFDRATFADGWIEIETDSAYIPFPPDDPPNCSLAVDQAFQWPHARRRDGQWMDLSRIPAVPDERHEHICLVPRNGFVRLVAPRFKRALVMRFETSQQPYALVWQDFRAPGGSLWGVIDTFAVEPSTNPGRSADDAVNEDAILWLDPGQSAEVEVSFSWRDA